METVSCPPPWNRFCSLNQVSPEPEAEHQLLNPNFSPISNASDFDAKLLDELVPQASSDTPLKLFALLGARRSSFLKDLLDISGLPHACLYDLDQDNDDDGAGAPWLVELDPGSPFTASTFTLDPEAKDPRRMFGDGIWIWSPLSLQALRAHLRRYTRFEDERSVWMLFRLQEPGMLDALLQTAPCEARRRFFSGIHRIIYPWPALTEGEWDLFAMEPPTSSTQNTSSDAGGRMLLEQRARKALACFVNDRTARKLAVERNSSARRTPCRL